MSSIKIRTKRIAGSTQIRILIVHPMDERQDAKTVTPNFIKSLTLKHNDALVVHSNISSNIASNPFFSFSLNGGEAGDTVTVAWEDNLGQRDSETVKLN